MGQRKKLKRFNKILRRIKGYQEQTAQLSDEQLAHRTVEFKERLASGESLDDLLPEAFAAICEADNRILGMMPFDVQILGGIALHQGYLAEMNTGEGKTLTATMPLYLNALTGKGSILVTANEYLALRDAEEMGPVYRFMGLSVGAGARAKKDERITNAEKKTIYASDIVYTTHGALGFDYLLNNLVTAARDRFMRELNYVIIDEADSVLLDAAQMPLVISASPRVQSNLYELADFFVTTLKEDVDYKKEEKMVWLTEEGIRYAETFFQIDNFYGREYFEINRHVTLALRAHALFEKGKAYMVSNKGELALLDGGSGRLMPGVKLRGGQHQALETKEKVEITPDNRSVASITYQNLFLLFDKMSGMSGTLADATEELRDVYGRDVLIIPPNRPLIRKDLPDLYFKNADSQFEAAIDTALKEHQKGRPVLIVVSTIAQTELVSAILMEEQIPHSVLNANNAFWEADMIREAGKKSTVTVATSMAGRGTDIRLEEGVKELGGLAVIGIGRMSNIRQERQARGRAGRQGDTGSSQFFVSIEDSVVADNGPKKMEAYIEGKKWISRRRVKKIVKKAQALVEERAVLSRKQAVSYDQVLQRQRKLIYATRDHLLDGGVIQMEHLLEIARDNIRHFIETTKKMDAQVLNRYILDNISYRLDGKTEQLFMDDPKEIEEYLFHLVKKGLKEQDRRLEGRANMNEFVRVAVLSAIDNAWVEQVDYLQQLQPIVSGRSTAQRNLVFEYHKEAYESFCKMERMALRDAMRNILLSDVYVDEESKMHIVFP